MKFLIYVRAALAFVAQAVLGLVIIAYCGDLLHHEFFSPTRSLIMCGVLGAGMLLGGLLMPYAGGWITTAARRGIALGQLGRRAYDNKGLVITTSDIEIPPTIPPAPPTTPVG